MEVAIESDIVKELIIHWIESRDSCIVCSVKRYWLDDYGTRRVDHGYGYTPVKSRAESQYWSTKKNVNLNGFETTENKESIVDILSGFARRSCQRIWVNEHSNDATGHDRMPCKL